MEKQIAKTCHAIHRAYCIENNIKTQPEWNDLDEKHIEVIIDSVRKILSGEIKTKEESHLNFVKYKISQGWKYSKIYSVENKTNPRLTEFNNLTIEQRTKEALFIECVKSFI